MIEDKEKYRNECAKRSKKIFELQGKKDFIDKLVDEFGDASITDISLAIDEDLEKAQKSYDDFTREETETMLKMEEKYDSGKILDLIADGYDRIDMVNAYLKGDL